MNHRFSEMMELSDDLVQRGANAADIVNACVVAGSISAASGKIIVAEIEDSQAGESSRPIRTSLRGRSLSWTFQPMAGGGAVVLLEDITERRNAEARISHLARYDELTALPNRVNFRDEIERLLTVPHDAGRLSALLFIDLDQFKQVNDTLGHPCGDQLLCAVAERLRDDAAAGGFCRALRRRRVRGVPAEHQIERGCRRAGPPDRRSPQRALQDRQSSGRDRRQRRHRDDVARHHRRHAAEERRHGAVPRQGRRPRHLLLLPRGNGADRRGPPHPGTRSAQGAGQRGIRAVLSSRWSTSSPARSRPARRCCAGTIRCAARCRRSTSFRSPRTWA